VRSLYAVEGNTYTDKSTKENMRNVTFYISATEAENVKQKLQLALFVAGFKNKVKITTSKYNTFARSGGYTYLRINNCILD
jgi:hypothetical protein